MTYKIVVNSSRGDRMLVEDDNGEKQWYFLAEKVKGISKNFKPGNLINFQHSIVNGKKTISFIEKTGEGSAPSPNEEKFPTKGTEGTRVPDPRNKDKEEERKYWETVNKEKTDTIVKQTAAKCASTALTVLAGQLDPEKICEEWNKLYENIHAKIT